MFGTILKKGKFMHFAWLGWFEACTGVISLQHSREVFWTFDVKGRLAKSEFDVKNIF